MATSILPYPGPRRRGFSAALNGRLWDHHTHHHMRMRSLARRSGLPQAGLSRARRRGRRWTVDDYTAAARAMDAPLGQLLTDLPPVRRRTPHTRFSQPDSWKGPRHA